MSVSPQFISHDRLTAETRQTVELVVACEPRPNYYDILPPLPEGLNFDGARGRITGMLYAPYRGVHQIHGRWRAAAGAPERANIRAVQVLLIEVRDEEGAPPSPPAASPPDAVDFFALDTPCPTPGCDQLRLLYKTDVAKSGDNCTGCAAAALRRKYLHAYRNLLAESG